jgi:tetratricopeptide (TPR) repeat protein
MVAGIAGRRVWFLGRFEGISHRRLRGLVRAAGAPAVPRAADAGVVAVAHTMAWPLLAGEPALARLESFADGTDFASEMTMRRLLGLARAEADAPRPYDGDALCRLAGLDPELLFWLDLFDVLDGRHGHYGYRDLVAARQVAQLMRRGADFAAVVTAAVALGRRGIRLAETQLAQLASGEVARCVDGDLLDLDGQYRLPLGEPEESVDDVLATAEDAELAGDLGAAARLYDRAAGMDPLDPVVPFHLGNVLEAQGATAEAELAWWRAVRCAPDFADAWFNLAVLAEGAGHDAKALPLYRSALSRDPDHADAAYNLGMLLARRQAHAEALPLLERFLALEPAAPETPNARWHAANCRFALRGVFLNAL